MSDRYQSTKFNPISHKKPHSSLISPISEVQYHVNMESLQSHFILTMSHWSRGLPVCFPSQGTRVQIPRGVLMWNQDSPVSDVSLHWWPRRDWSLWPPLRRASSQTVTRPSCRQFDNPIWSHTAFLSRFHARCRSPFRLHNRRSRLLGGSPVESLQSHLILTMSHWSSGLPIYFPSQGTRVQIPRGVIMWNRDAPVSEVPNTKHNIFYLNF
jgi:hypothetical protein